MFPVKRLHKRLEKIQRPLAVVVGSALSVTRGAPNQGVPDVDTMIERIRMRMVDERLGEDFEEALREGKGSRYQEAFAFVQSTLGAEAVDSIVREAVLEARLPGAPALEDGDGDGNSAHWHLPRGTAALGRLLAAKDSRFTGPILTTNFDPLLSMAIEHAGGVVDRRVLDRDGHLPGHGDSRHGARVVHLHGYWRGSTLHLPQHLGNSRSKLLGSLRDLLGGHTVLVIAYGGWRDAFMQALEQVIDQPETAVDILWCLYGDEGTALHNNQALLARFGGYTRFSAYYGVDAHQLFDELAPPNGLATGNGRARPASESTAGPDVLVHADELERYLGRLEAEHSTVPLVGFQTKTRISLALHDLYVPLDAIIDRGSRGRDLFDSAEMAERRKAEDAHLRRERLALADAFTRARELNRRSLVLLGDPGSGKTTHLKQILLKVIRDGPESVGLAANTIPVFLSLQAVRNRETKLEGLIASQLRGPALDMPDDFGQRLLRHGKLLLLLDGLDEVADAEERAEVSRWIETAHRQLRDAVVLVSCRYAGYTPDVELGAEFLELHLRPLDDEQMQAFVWNWYRLVMREQMLDANQAELRARDLANDLLEVLAQPEFGAAGRVYEMTRNPLLLTAICLVHHDHGRLPKARVRLYEETIAVLLERWRRRPSGPVMPPEDVLEVLQSVAAWMHSKRGRRRASAAELRVTVSEALQALKTEISAEEFMRAIRDESGLLTGWGVDEYGFMHLGLQEFLVAQHCRNVGLLNHNGFEELAARFGDSWWQEVILLTLAQRNPPVFEPFMRALVQRHDFGHLAVSQMMDLCLDEASGWSAAPFLELLHAPAVGDVEELSQRQVGAAKVLTRNVKSALEVEGLLHSHPVPAVRNWWLRHRNIEAVGAEVIVHPKTGIELVRIAGGVFSMGSLETEIGRDEDESPRQEVVLQAFCLARTPVTNAQYGRFLAASPDAPKPAYWADRRYNQPDQPVVGVSWHDAKAYCEWAGLMLPTEAQWEYACRAGTATRYWSGNDESDLARVGWYRENSDERLHIAGELAVSPFGLHDMHGNAWEWCLDEWAPNYDAEPRPGDGLRHDAIGNGLFVVRGGSWDAGADFARSAHRDYRPPGNRDSDVGFRPVLLVP